jgi:hypothetical protein
MNLASFTLSPSAAVSNGICLSQSAAGAGNLTINGSLASGGVATLDIARRVAITSTANLSARTFTITGTDRYGYSQSESITGPNNSTVYTTKDFKTVTQIAINGTTSGNTLTVGTNGVMSTAWFCGDYLTGKPVTSTIALSTGAVLTYTVEFTQTNLNDLTLDAASRVTQAQSAVVFSSSDTNVVAASTSQATNFLAAQPGMRLTLNSYTSGSATITYVSPNNSVW